MTFFARCRIQDVVEESLKSPLAVAMYDGDNLKEGLKSFVEVSLRPYACASSLTLDTCENRNVSRDGPTLPPSRESSPSFERTFVFVVCFVECISAPLRPIEACLSWRKPSHDCRQLQQACNTVSLAQSSLCVRKTSSLFLVSGCCSDWLCAARDSQLRRFGGGGRGVGCRVSLLEQSSTVLL